MRTTTTRRLTRYVALPAAAVGLTGAAALGITGIANAGTMPTNGPTVSMSIANDTDVPITLQSSNNPGMWINAPRQILPPHTSEVVTSHLGTPNSLDVSITYAFPGGNRAIFVANDNPGDANVQGSGVTNGSGDFDMNHSFASGYPTMNASYTLFGHH